MQGWSLISFRSTLVHAFDRVSHCSLLFKLKSIGVGVSVRSICTEFLSDRRQRVVVDGAERELISIISGVPH